MEILILIPLFIIGSIFTIILIAVLFSKSVIKTSRTNQRENRQKQSWNSDSVRSTGELMYKENATDEIHNEVEVKRLMEDMEESFRKSNLEYSGRRTKTRQK
ncbi:MAG: hypothetical protein K0M69_06955 [Youngiibacter sp.]|nr:hypothetical protein [Youngiibacter sp.]